MLLAGATDLAIDRRAVRDARVSAHDLATVFEIALAAVVLGLAVWTIRGADTFAASVGFVA